MTSEKFEEFLKRKQHEEADIIRGARTRKTKWLASIDDLYKEIKTILLPYFEKRLLDVRESSMFIKENYIGEYEIRKLILTIGATQIEFIPQGTYVKGCLGRVDMVSVYGDGKAFLLLMDKWVFGDEKYGFKGHIFNEKTLLGFIQEIASV